METSEKTYPYQLPFGIQAFGRSYSVWVYDSVPDGMHRVKDVRELRGGQTYLQESLLSKGEYITGVMRPSVREAVARMIADGIAVFVKA